MISKQTSQTADHYEDAPVEDAISAGEVVIGTLAGIDGEGRPQVEFAHRRQDEPLVATSLVSVTHEDKGRQVALLFAEGDPQKPVVMGLIHSPLQDMIADFELLAAGGKQETDTQDNASADEPVASPDAYVDGERVVIEGKKEIVLKCGDASITLTRSGKILIRGKYLLNRSSGVNRIMGGSVQVN